MKEKSEITRMCRTSTYNNRIFLDIEQFITGIFTK